MGKNAGGPFGSPELPEVTDPTLGERLNMRQREWRDAFDMRERARRLHDYLTRRAFNGEGELPAPLEPKLLHVPLSRAA